MRERETSESSDEGKDEVWGNEFDRVLLGGLAPIVTFTCQACHRAGSICDFAAVAPSETAAGLPLCNECVSEPPAADNISHPFCQFLQSSGRDS